MCVCRAPWWLSSPLSFVRVWWLLLPVGESVLLGGAVCRHPESSPARSEEPSGLSACSGPGRVGCRSSCDVSPVLRQHRQPGVVIFFGRGKILNSVHQMNSVRATSRRPRRVRPRPVQPERNNAERGEKGPGEPGRALADVERGARLPWGRDGRGPRAGKSEALKCWAWGSRPRFVWLHWTSFGANCIQSWNGLIFTHSELQTRTVEPQTRLFFNHHNSGS